MEKIYCISGLGADQRIFGRLSIPGYELVPLHWVPFDKHDDIPCYAQKMAASLKEENPIILGVSYGGMVAVEIGKIIPAKKIFLVSSAKVSAELGPQSGFIKWVMKKEILPPLFFKIPNRIVVDRLGAKTKEEKEFINQQFHDADGRFMQWAFSSLATWKNKNYPSNLIHIHGTADQIMAPQFVHPDYWIKGGSHIMVYNKPAEVGKIIANHLPG